MIKNLAILIVVMIFGFELYISTKGSQHRKKKRIKGWNIVKGNILSTEKKRDARTGKSYVELIIETTTGRTVTEKDGIFSIYEVGEEVLLQEKDGYHRFIGNDRVDKIGRKELLLGLIPMVAIIGIAAILSFVI
ncbi:hypothetical protein SAMN05660484_01401 [Eubacterium ruminantium]|uniref:Uncharacterized protein n=1 Tax=Eubacterium ruminantium TaxID=42322 RepID=A0A1T4N032_9FIRM|nr:hypothetical protein [Eubacterium ruminantium]SCW51252.1 hypothetical protein SAMN05660484_01401 [Eubacterium ruminantium]SDM68329.1 hypothetical protein SAMN04490370_105126 [Eubacterium ruminantium]SJZ72592.1 hypothetical protein SAMN02745110_01401 [Eubacterium ruminantium]